MYIIYILRNTAACRTCACVHAVYNDWQVVRGKNHRLRLLCGGGGGDWQRRREKAAPFVAQAHRGADYCAQRERGYTKRREIGPSRAIVGVSPHPWPRDTLCGAAQCTHHYYLLRWRRRRPHTSTGCTVYASDGRQSAGIYVRSSDCICGLLNRGVLSIACLRLYDFFRDFIFLNFFLWRLCTRLCFLNFCEKLKLNTLYYLLYITTTVTIRFYYY